MLPRPSADFNACLVADFCSQAFLAGKLLKLFYLVDLLTFGLKDLKK